MPQVIIDYDEYQSLLEHKKNFAKVFECYGKKESRRMQDQSLPPDRNYVTKNYLKKEEAEKMFNVIFRDKITIV